MKMVGRRSKMVSFRVSPEEYSSLCQACSAQGLRSVSELARTAVNNMIRGSRITATVDDQLQDLRARVQTLSTEVERLSRHVDRPPLGIAVATSAAGSV